MAFFNTEVQPTTSKIYLALRNAIFVYINLAPGQKVSAGHGAVERDGAVPGAGAPGGLGVRELAGRVDQLRRGVHAKTVHTAGGHACRRIPHSQKIIV